jgi:hypothetical protein
MRFLYTRKAGRAVPVLVLAASMLCAQAAAQTQTPGLISIAVTGTLVNLSWNCASGRCYQLLGTAVLGRPWLEVDTVPKPLVAASNRLQYALSLLPSNQFYCVTELPDPAETNGFQIEVTTTTAAQDFVCSFINPGTLHVNWGDGSSEDFNASTTNRHTYAATGAHTVRLSGRVVRIDFFIYPDPGIGTPKLISAIKTPVRGIAGMTSAYEMFKHCENITAIPEGLFDQCPGITYFYDTFLACSKLTTIPPGLFNTQTNVTNFYAVFDNCDVLKEIPAGLFDKHTNVTDISWAFAKCYAITNVPAGLFDCHRKNRKFDHVFYRCYALRTIPPMLFASNTQVTTYANAFEDCRLLTGASPTNGSGQKLWELSPVPTGTLCFRNCTNLSDYAAIPAEWK